MNIISKRLWFFIIAGVLALVCIISLATVGIKTGVEFSSGSILTVSFEQTVDQIALKEELATFGYEEALIQKTGSGDYVIRTPELNETARNTLVNELTDKFGKFEIKEFDSVSSMIALETARNAGIAVIVSAVAILLYIAWAFRKMPSPFKEGTCLVAGLVFDMLMALGIFSILGAIRGWQIDLMFVAGVLAVVGVSVDNTVVVFDRIRENMAKGISRDIEEVANFSVVETMGRSFNTSLTMLITLFALALFVGTPIQNFVVVLIIGIVSGIFTSICLSPELLVAWQKKNWGSLSGRATNMATVKAKI